MKYNCKNMTTATGRPIANQFVIETPRARLFQSYDKIIVKIDLKTDAVYLDAKYWKYSATTSKYRAQFLSEDTATTQAKIDAGEYTLVRLNP